MLDPVEPNLSASIELEDGRGFLTVNITPEALEQQHTFRFEVDQSYLPDLIQQLSNVVKKHEHSAAC